MPGDQDQMGSSSGEVVLARDYFSLETIEPNWLAAGGGALLSMVTNGLYGGAKTVVRIRSVGSGEVLLEVPFRCADGSDVGQLNMYVGRMRQELETLTPREFAAEHKLAWPPGGEWR